MEAHLSKAHYVMTDNGIGGWSATFGPIADRSLALLAAERLNKQGIKTHVAGELEAKATDCHGVSHLIAKASGKPIDWE